MGQGRDVSKLGSWVFRRRIEGGDYGWEQLEEEADGINRIREEDEVREGLLSMLSLLGVRDTFGRGVEMQKPP
jgi:hypothetical protein